MNDDLHFPKTPTESFFPIALKICKNMSSANTNPTMISDFQFSINYDYFGTLSVRPLLHALVRIVTS